MEQGRVGGHRQQVALLEQREEAVTRSGTVRLGQAKERARQLDVHADRELEALDALVVRAEIQMRAWEPPTREQGVEGRVGDRVELEAVGVERERSHLAVERQLRPAVARLLPALGEPRRRD